MMSSSNRSRRDRDSDIDRDSDKEDDSSSGHDDGQHHGDLVPNPFIKKRNLEWRVSPPPLKRQRRSEQQQQQPQQQEQKQNIGASGDNNNNTLPTTTTTSTAIQHHHSQQHHHPSSAAVEAGKAKIRDHSTYFSNLLASHFLPSPNTPLLPIPDYKALYDQSINNPRGAHFVIHQHNHPIAGTHYDLRLQINETSSCSWAIMYGLPGDPNSIRQGRNATETRVHCLWNHLVETASRETGSLIIWDTGRYRVLDNDQKAQGKSTGDEDSEWDVEGNGGKRAGGGDGRQKLTEQQKLAAAFAKRKIKLSLEGARLPRPYVVNLRLTTADDVAGRSRALGEASRPPRKRKRRGNGGKKKKVQLEETSSERSSEESGVEELAEPDGGLGTTTIKAPGAKFEEREKDLSEMERELQELEDEQVRRTNAYPGAVNTIGSVHQRRWYLSLDRTACGFVKKKRETGGTMRVVWEKASWTEKETPKNAGEDDSEPGGQNTDNSVSKRLEYPFYVLGPDHERSVVTGRLEADVLRDEGVENFVRRKGWHPVTK